jgi:hypothetical protein
VFLGRENVGAANKIKIISRMVALYLRENVFQAGHRIPIIGPIKSSGRDGNEKAFKLLA